MWEQVQGFLDSHFKELGVKNCYFPLFIPKKYLCKEEEHLEVRPSVHSLFVLGADINL